MHKIQKGWRREWLFCVQQSYGKREEAVVEPGCSAAEQSPAARTVNGGGGVTPDVVGTEATGGQFAHQMLRDDVVSSVVDVVGSGGVRRR